MEASGNILSKIAVVPNVPDERTCLLNVLGHGHISECGALADVCFNAGGINGMSQEICVRGAKLGFRGRV